ncbi:hypothetical protein T07_6109 [Trichinella nelsoni]|uniref:Uncharacterized protein n=1 Tax=Trichinella nelsoni TaxID=6336 RepID=A0A0V0RHX4_9BILA|nr:hypothetical protein T07_6109 [Trichinella nelsoni]
MVAQSLVLCGFAWSEQLRCHSHFILTPFHQLTTGVVAGKQGVQLALRHRCFRTRKKRFLNTSHPRKVDRVYASPDGSTRRSDIADQVTVPCLVFTVADLTTPSSLGWISMILPISHWIHAALAQCHPLWALLDSHALLIPPSPYQVVHSTCGVITPVDFGTHTW